jgi:Rieske Fe-S protein
MPALNRREALQGLAALCVGCAGSGRDSALRDTATGCTSASSGVSTGYCLVENLVVRVGGGALLRVGESMLGNVDDNTAVLVGRDDAGFYARSAICTHACCIVAVCDDDGCTSPNPSPESCGTVGPVSSDRVLCPCHGSIFRVSDGEALTGPATTPLPPYAVAVDGDDLLVDTGTEVDATARTPS